MSLIVKIEKCDDGMMWYSNYVGESFKILRNFTHECLVRTPDGTTNIILHTDSTIKEENEKSSN